MENPCLIQHRLGKDILKSNPTIPPMDTLGFVCYNGRGKVDREEWKERGRKGRREGKAKKTDLGFMTLSKV